MLYTSRAPILDLTEKDIEDAFHTLNLCPQEDNDKKSNGRKETGGTNKPK